MEEAYATVAGAVSRLVSDASGEDQYLESKAVLQSVLHRRPVVLRFVVCTLATKLKGWTRSVNPVPHVGIYYALESLLASYDPCAPNSIGPVIDALGEEGSKALLHTSGDGASSLPWASRLCLLHACLADGGTRGGRRWGWLPTTADSACSQALQAVAKCGTSSSSSRTAKGKERARAAVDVGGDSVVGGRTTQGGSRGVVSGGGVSSSVVLRICSELAMAGTAISGPSVGRSFLSGFLRGAGAQCERQWSLPGGYILRERGEDWLQGFLFKLHTLRDAILSNAEGGGEDQGEARVAEGGTVAYGGDVGTAVHGADIPPEVVGTALERSRCGEAFIRAVQAALEAEQTAMTALDGQRKRKFAEGRAESVQLKSALEVCLFGAGLPSEQGLVDVLADDIRPDSIENNSAIIGIGAAAAAVSMPARVAGPTPIHVAHTFLRCLVTGGVRVRDLLVSLLHLQRVYGRSPNVDIKDPLIPGAGKRAAATIALRIPRGACRLALPELVKSLVEWLPESGWAWASVEGYAGDRRWEDDLAAAAIAVTDSVAFGAGTSSGAASGAEPSGVLLDGGWRYRRDFPLGGEVCNRGVRTSITDPIELLDRLVAVAAAARAAQNLSWVDVVGRMVAVAKTGPVCAYAAACVERSVALGGQASFPMVEEQRLSQVGGRELWRLLEQACALRRESGGGGRACVVLIRAAVAAVISCREASGSGMISPGMTKSSPIRLVIDMIKEACGTVSVADVMSGLLSRPGDEGPALAADMFAAIVGSETAIIAAGGSGCCDAGDEDLREQTVQWLSNALSTIRSSPGRPKGLAPEKATAVASLMKSLSKRVPYETKTVLKFVCEAAESSRRNTRSMLSQRLSYADQAVSGGSAQQSAHKCGDGDPLEALIQVAQAARETPLLPLPVPLSPSLFPEEEGGAEAGAEAAVPAGDGARGAARERRQAAAEATAGLLLDAFMQSPGVVQRAVRAAMQRGNCSHELLAVQRALRVALCTQPGSSIDDGRPDDDGHVLPPGLGSRRADACLLMGHFVELGVPGWAEAKAAMDPPPPQLVAAAETPFGKKIVDHSSQRPTALRLELWLRNLLRDCDADLCHGSGEPGEVSFPDVFRTARTLARALSRHASAIIIGDSFVTNGPGRFHAGNGSFVDTLSHPRRIQSENEYNSDNRGGDRPQHRHKNCGSLAPPRRALAGRLGSVPAVGALQSWVSGVAKTTARYKRWLPWQAFSDELRQLVLLQTRQPVPPTVDGRVGGSMGDGVAAVAATVAVCELLLAWDGGQEVLPAVFDPALCSSALNTAVAPVPQGLDPPVWLTVLRCLVEGNKSNMIKWTAIHRHGGGVPQDFFALVAAASVWIGGGGPGAGGHHNAAENAHEAWIQWYGAKLGSIILTVGVASGKWLVLSVSTGENMSREVKVHGGMGLVARTLTSEAWEYWGRSPLEAAWNIPAGLEEGVTMQGPPAIALPPFSVWLRIVLRVSGKGCSESIVDGYMRRMAREVYLPCEFGGASSEMARQWLGALIEAEVAADARALDPAESESSAQMSADATRRAIVKAFFREELLRFGSGEAPVAAVGGPLTWLWPLEAVVSACGRAGPFGVGVLTSHHGADMAAEDTVGQSQVLLDGPPSALARALSSVPHDLLCGSRRFGIGGGRPPPATLRAFATRVVNLAARALATPPCRHWSVARRLLLGLGLLYHALAIPAQSASGGKAASQSPSLAASRTVSVAGGNSSVGKEEPEAVAAQAAALNTIESLLRISFGLGNADTEGASTDGVTGWQQRSTGLTSFKSGTFLLPTACRSLRPLEAGGRGGWEDFLQDLCSAGAWRAAAALVKPWNVENLGPNPLSKSPAVLSRRSATPAVSRPKRQSLAAVAGADAGEVERPMAARETQRDSAVNVEKPAHEFNGTSLATSMRGALCLGDADNTRQQDRGQGNGDAILSCPRASQASLVSAGTFQKGQNLAHGSKVDLHGEKLAEAGQKESSFPRRTLRSTRRMGRSN